MFAISSIKQFNSITYTRAQILIFAKLYQKDHNYCFLDPTILDELKPWAESVHEAGSELLGVTRVPLKRDICGIGECNIGSFVTDAYVHGVRYFYIYVIFL